MEVAIIVFKYCCPRNDNAIPSLLIIKHFPPSMSVIHDISYSGFHLLTPNFSIDLPRFTF